MEKQISLFTHQTLSRVKEFAKIKSETGLRLKVRDAFFADYSVEVEDERIDFLVYHEHGGLFTETFLWAESKDKPTDVVEMFAQLLLTVKKKVDAGEMPPKYLGVFDREKIAFAEYYNALDIFHLNDFDWTERPSAVSKKTVNQVAKYLKNVIVFNFAQDTQEIIGFIRQNFLLGKTGTTKSQINKNNFVTVYNKWVREVLPTIGLSKNDWEDIKKKGVGDCEFYLADLLSEDNKTISDKLNIVLQSTYYESKVRFVGSMKFYYEKIGFRDEGKEHAAFWNRYERPPKEEYHKHIIERRDLLVPQHIRERKGAYFTPQIWVEKSQEYLAKVFGENWQDEYYIWDCCAGTCNLLAGLTEKHRIWASTIDQPDVDIVHELIAKNEFNLLAKHVFQFDFLNDDFAKLPKSLRDIINDPEKRKKLVIYMNPPYAEARGQQVGKSNKKGFHLSKTRDKYLDEIGKAAIEMFAQFAIRIYSDLPDAKLAMFSKLKYVNAPNFERFRDIFKATYKNGFIVPANTFDNVKGRFPIGFLIWDLEDKKTFKQIKTDVFDRGGHWRGIKTHYCYDKKTQLINDWVKTFPQIHKNQPDHSMATIIGPAADFQHQSTVWILAPNNKSNWFHWQIGKENLIGSSIYCAVRHCIESTWLNDRDQFLYPNDTYKTDKEFQTDCLIFTLLHHQNRIRSNGNTNHWIPFTAREVDARENFQSTFMSDLLANRKKRSKEAKAVFEAGKALWKYYHETITHDDSALTDASLYEIREYFKGRNEKGRMKTKSSDERFNELDAALRLALKKLAKKIQPKVYEYGFLRK